MDVDVAGLALVGLAPDRAQQPALGDEPARVGRAGRAGSRTRAASARPARRRPDLVAGGVERRAARPRSGRSASAAGPGGAPERDADPGVELVDAERLGHVVVGAALERLDLLALLVRGRTGSRSASSPRGGSGGRRRGRPCPAGRGRAGRGRAGGAPSARAPSRPSAASIDPVAARRELADERRARLVVVLDDEDRRAAGGRPVAVIVGARPALGGDGAARAAGRCRSASPPSSLRRARDPAAHRLDQAADDGQPDAGARARARRRRPAPGRTCRTAAAARRPGRPGRRPRRRAGPAPSPASPRRRRGSGVPAACT